MELESVIDRWHSQQKAQGHYNRHLLAAAVVVVIGAGLIWAEQVSWGITLSLGALAYGALQHALLGVLVHHTYPVPDELLLMIAAEPALSDNFKRQLANALNTDSVITFGELRELGWRIERDDIKASARTQDGFRTLTDRYPAASAESAQ